MAEQTFVGNRYKLLTQIGEGGMSNVYLALDTVLNKQWAAKEIKCPDDPTERDVIVRSIETEANMIKRLDHPAIPRIVDIVDESGVLYVIMDYVEGRTLAAVLEKEGPQSEDDVRDWGIQLCDVLSYLHSRNPPVIYRDMKPSNVMLKPNRSVQVIDFGIAREHRGDDDGSSLRRGDTTQLGTRGFAPPEQYGDDSQTDQRSDIYALGATLYNLLTGRSPADPPYEIVPVRQVRADLSLGIERVIAKATQTDPDERFENCAQLAYALSRYQHDDEQHRARLKQVWRSFLLICFSAALFLALGVFGTVGRIITLNSDYGYWMDVAARSSDEREAAGAYIHAIGIKPEQTAPYHGLATLYRTDQNFSISEETQLRQTLLPHLSDVKSSRDFAALAFDIGKLYWYNYAATGTEESVGTEARSTRIRAAAQWMRSAADDKDFDQHDLAQAYADIASFNTSIVPLINEGSDKGLYRPYFDQLGYLVGQLKDEDNDVMRLEVSNLVLDALVTYPRKFRADGVTQQDMLGLIERARGLAERVHPTTELLDAEQHRVADLEPLSLTAIGNAYQDTEA